MGTIIVNDRKGNSHKLDAQVGMKVMEIIRDAGLEIEAACGGCCACATCHVYIHNNWFENNIQTAPFAIAFATYRAVTLVMVCVLQAPFTSVLTLQTRLRFMFRVLFVKKVITFCRR